jgi:hypothetical protein
MSKQARDSRQSPLRRSPRQPACGQTYVSARQNRLALRFDFPRGEIKSRWGQVIGRVE